jgi:cation-transporting ATPase G
VRNVQLAALAGILLLAALLAGALGAEAVALGAEVGALIAGGLTFIPQSLRALPRRRLGVGTLMTIAALGAVALGEVGEAAMLAFLFSISEALESYALTRTRQGLRALLDLVPERATVLRGGQELTVAPAELVVGDVLVVRPGERLATDGVIRRGRSALDNAAITGESVPVEVGPGEPVFAAAINGAGALEVEVTARSQDNSLARIVRVVEEAQERKGRGQRLAERIARPLVPGVLIAGLLIAVAGSLLGDPATWIERSLVVLVAAAPCAFAISVPVTVVAAIGAATRSGVLIKGGAALEALGDVRAVAFDKTGTLTRNDPRVVEVVAADGRRDDDVLAVAAALEARSEHPLARAVLAAAPAVPGADDVEAVPGNGLVGRVDGAPARLGKPGFVPAGALAGEVARLQGAGATVVVVERANEPLGLLAVRDDPRPEAAEAVALLHGAGFAPVVTVTGDHRRTAEAIAAEVGIDEVHAELLPVDKVEVVERIRRDLPVAMVGDGVNDAPALASARVGVAMGAMGSDVAIEAADVALMGDDLRVLPDALTHARHAGRIMRQNLALSGAILLALIPLAATGALGLAAVVAIHEVAEVFVIANGVRAGRRHAFHHRLALDRPPVSLASAQSRDLMPA